MSGTTTNVFDVDELQALHTLAHFAQLHHTFRGEEFTTADTERARRARQERKLAEKMKKEEQREKKREAVRQAKAEEALAKKKRKKAPQGRTPKETAVKFEVKIEIKEEVENESSWMPSGNVVEVKQEHQSG